MYAYSLRIDAQEDKLDMVSRILGVDSNYPEVGWGIEIIDTSKKRDMKFFDYFLSVLEGHYGELNEIGISENDISIWMLYEYDQQCNMEFSPKYLSAMGNNGITFCISCWQK